MDFAQPVVPNAVFILLAKEDNISNHYYLFALKASTVLLEDLQP